jgi:16S rRNA (cytidine1402-2'-O)-methyltransferase
VDLVAAEDTRHTAKLLSHFGISRPMVSYWGEKEKVKAEAVMARLLRGESVALVSDAGTPGISDPGAVLIRRALEEGVSVVAIPGPSALVAALGISGLPTEEFTFFGFSPSKKGERQRFLRERALEPRTMVFYESPHRVVDTLVDMEEILGGGRRAAVIRELTKVHEEALRGTLSGVLDMMQREGSVIAGEYVIVLEGKPPEAGRTLGEALEEVAALMKRGMGRKEAVRTVAGQYGLSRRELYQRSLGSPGT